MSWRPELSLSLLKRTDVRLTFWYSLSLLIILALICGFFAYRLYHDMVKQVDALLRDEVKEVEGFLRREDSGVVTVKWFIRTQLDQREHFRLRLRVIEIREGGVHELGESSHSGPFFLDASLLEKLRKGRPIFHTIPARIPYRQLSLLLSSPSGGVHLVQISTRLELIRNALVNLLKNFLVLVPAVVLLCAMGGWLMARKALWPIHRIATTAERISAQNLKERLPSPNTGDDMDHLIRTINRMLDRIEGSFEEIQRFSADVAHELRTPLCAMRGEAEVLLSRPRPAEEYRTALESFMEQLERLTHLINSLLLLARFEANPRLERSESVPLAPLLQDLGEFFGVLAQDKGIRFHMHSKDDPVVRGDPGRLQQVFTNLLDNAVKYTPCGGKVTVDLRKIPPWGEVEIRNTGDGISPEDLPRLFDRFYRAEKSRSRRTGGAGLGLNIAQKIVEMHEGRIHIQSLPGQAVSVTVRIPLSLSASPASI